jgi:peptidoglycan/LPS O-acetylase OafA/YrhL
VRQLASSVQDTANEGPPTPTIPAQRLPGSTRLDSLTGLRFFAALAVALFHANYLLEGSARAALHPFVDQGRVGVSFFFILSGFVLCWSSSNRDGARAFYWRRIARIYPAYATARVLGLALLLVGATSTSASKVVVAALLLQSWVPDANWYFSTPGVSWSLSVEAFFYLAFPLLLVGLARLDARARRVVALVCVATPMVLAAVAQAHYSGHGYVDLPNDTMTWAVVYLPLARLPEFTLGILAALELRDRGRAPVSWRPALTLALAAYVACGIWPSMLTQIAVTALPFTLLIVAAAEQDLAGHLRFLTSRRLVWLGEISFCFYLVHTLVGLVIARLPLMRSFLGVALFLGLSVVAAALLHRFVEVPTNRSLLRWRKTVPVARR